MERWNVRALERQQEVGVVKKGGKKSLGIRITPNGMIVFTSVFMKQREGPMNSESH